MSPAENHRFRGSAAKGDYGCRVSSVGGRRLVAAVVSMALTLSTAVGLAALTIAPPAQARYAESGSGLYSGSIDWIEWGYDGSKIPKEGITRTESRTIGGQTLLTTCTISGIEGQVSAYRSGGWVGDAFDDLYNIGGVGSQNLMVAGIANTKHKSVDSFDFSCEATLDGVPVELDGLVVADAESSNTEIAGAQEEFIQARPDTNATWRIIDRLRSEGCETSVTTLLSEDGTMRLGTDNRECYYRGGGNGPMVVGFMEGTTSARITLQGGGKSAVALGAVLHADFGDAPESYGSAGALFAPVWEGGTVPVGTTRVSGSDFPLGSMGAPGTRLGSLIDSESHYQASPMAQGDDLEGGEASDEDAVGILDPFYVTPGVRHTLRGISCQGPGTVYGWVDWNSNGQFDAGERSDPAECGGDSVDLTWTVPRDVVSAGGSEPTFMRLRISKGGVGSDSPIGMTTSGEVEDRAVEVVVPELSIEKTSNATADSRPGDTVTYTIRATNNTATSFTKGHPAVVSDDLSAVLDDADYLNDVRASQPGTLDYDSALGRLVWAGPLAGGESVELTYSVILKSGGDGVVRNVAWGTPTTEKLLPPTCDPPVAGHDTDSGVPCAVVKYQLPRLEVKKTADTTEVHQAGSVINYTVTVRNLGPGDYTKAAPANLVDDLTQVVSAATYNDDAGASTGTLSYSAPKLNWSGALKANEAATIKYSVTYQGKSDHKLTNVACVPVSEAKQANSKCATVTVLGSLLSQWKEVESSTTPVLGGTELTYKLHFRNDGTQPAVVDTHDDLTDVLDDADIISEPQAEKGLSAHRNKEIITIKGTIPPGQDLTVTYRARIKPDGQRGNDLATNFLGVTPSTGKPPTKVCEPEKEFPTCTVTPVGQVVYEKSVGASADPITAGTVLTYTIKARNIGTGRANVAREDILSDVLDDATMTSPPVSDSPSVTVSAVTNDRFRIDGTLDSGQVATVSYQVTVKEQKDRGNSEIDNFLVPPGEPKPPEVKCVQCTLTHLPDIRASKTATPKSGTALVVGDKVKYTLTFENVGSASGTVDYRDALDDILDDAILSSPPKVSSSALKATSDKQGKGLHVVGQLDARQTATVTYTVTVKPFEQQVNHAMGNFLLETGEKVPPTCVPDSQRCTTHPIPDLKITKSVNPKSGTKVSAGDILTYTLRFENRGTAPAKIDRTDVMSGVLDDATWVGNVSADKGLTVGPLEKDRFTVKGSVAPGQVRTVTYQVRVKEYQDQGDHKLLNFFTNQTKVPPSPCASDDVTCTVNPTIQPPSTLISKPPKKQTQGLAVTGATAAAFGVLAVSLLAGGALLVQRGNRRSR